MIKYTQGISRVIFRETIMEIRRIGLTGVVVVVILLFSETTQAQDEQWLQYRSSQDARSMVSGLGGKGINLEKSRPEDVKVPQFNDKQPLFGKWVTPMTKAGFLWFALDRSKAKGPYDRLYIDSNGNGHLDDETALKPYRTESDQAQFGPVKVVLQGEDGPVSFHMDFMVYGSESNFYCYMSAAGWYEGEVSIDGAKTHCTVLDYTANGTFNETSLDPYKADRVVIGEKEGAGEPLCVGRFVDVNGVLYELEVARDGAFVKFKKAQDVRFGEVRVPAGISRLTVTGTNGQFRLTPKDQVLRVPVGRYCMTEWAMDRKDDKGRQWTAQGQTSGINDRWSLDVVESQEKALDIGEPLLCRLEVRSTGTNHTFQQQLEGRLGERITLLLGRNERPAPPKLNIRGKDGAYDRTLNFAYG
jgi:hypothetical protein